MACQKYHTGEARIAIERLHYTPRPNRNRTCTPELPRGYFQLEMESRETGKFNHSRIRVFHLILGLYPLFVKHSMAAPALANDRQQAIGVSMGHTHAIVPSSAHGPSTDLLRVKHILQLDPVQNT